MNLKEYVIRRLLLMIPVFIGVYTMVFIISRVLPGDPIVLMLGPSAGVYSPEQLAVLRHQLGLDQPIYVQYFSYLAGLFRGDWGYSLHTRRPVLSDLEQFFPATFELATASMIIAVVVGIPLGVVAATHRNKFLDNASRLGVLFGLSVPEFWSGIMFQIVFASMFRLLPVSGRWPTISSVAPPTHVTGLYVLDSLLTLNFPALIISLEYLILPAIVLSFSSMSQITRFVRAQMIEVSTQDFVSSARANGVPKSLVNYVYMLRNSLTTTLTMVGSVYALLLGGAFVVETVFAWPGIANYTVQSVLYKDFNSVIGAVIVFGLGFLIVNFVVDLLYGYLDPRVRYE
jgi:peptide/nickel transport system permease protein